MRSYICIIIIVIVIVLNYQLSKVKFITSCPEDFFIYLYNQIITITK